MKGAFVSDVRCLPLQAHRALSDERQICMRFQSFSLSVFQDKMILVKVDEAFLFHLPKFF